MGSGISLPTSLASIPTQGQIYDKTHDTIELMNQILHFILNNADIRDLINLSTDEGCSKWIIVAESKLSHIFEKLRIQPDAGKDGTLYIKRLSNYKKTQKEEDIGGKKHQEFCNVLAFFFIRLFQVVGALALSVMDSELPSKDYQETEKQTISQERKGIPFFDTKPKEGFLQKIKWRGEIGRAHV